ncbi:thioredoxin [Nostoc sp. 3335mG]|jgi:thiol-disulfide isomerase/thioredoxin|nr:thioredoxin [Nostoc sp. 3335mG]
MLLELSLRPLIALLLLTSVGIGGCDRQSNGAQQANENLSAPAPAANGAANATAGGEGGADSTRTLDRSHKGEAAPDYAFEDPKGAKTSLAAFRGKPLLLNLWATWCAPCVKEMPTLDALAVQLGDTKQVLVLSQDIDDGRKRVGDYFAKTGFKKLQPYLDGDAAFSLNMGVNLPATILYDSQGKEVWRMTGSLDWTGAEARALIAEAK